VFEAILVGSYALIVWAACFKLTRACTHKSAFCKRSVNVRFAPKATELLRRGDPPLCAKSGLTHRSKRYRYSITSSARAISVGGTVKSSAFAVLRLTTNSNLFGCCTASSAGFAPRRIRST